MTKAFTSQTLILNGDPSDPESAQYIVEFPGGSLEVSRTSNDEYWAHIVVHKGRILEDTMATRNGTVVDSRVEFVNNGEPLEVLELPDQDRIYHIAVRVKLEV